MIESSKLGFVTFQLDKVFFVMNFADVSMFSDKTILILHFCVYTLK